MIVIVKHFYDSENAQIDYDYMWNANKDHFIILHQKLTPSLQLDRIKSDLLDNIQNNIENDTEIDKNILAIRFPSPNFIKKNKIINNIFLGNGVMYDKTTGNIWYPKEVWIYHN